MPEVRERTGPPLGGQKKSWPLAASLSGQRPGYASSGLLVSRRIGRAKSPDKTVSGWEITAAADKHSDAINSRLCERGPRPALEGAEARPPPVLSTHTTGSIEKAGRSH